MRAYDKKVTANRLKEVMQEKGFNQVKLSEQTGISQSSISQYTSGYCIPSNINSGKMSLVLGVSPMWLMGFDVPKYQEEFKAEKIRADEVATLTMYYNKCSDTDRKILMDMARSLASKEN